MGVVGGEHGYRTIYSQVDPQTMSPSSTIITEVFFVLCAYGLWTRVYSGGGGNDSEVAGYRTNQRSLYSLK